jgi:hypothetical protein
METLRDITESLLMMMLNSPAHVDESKTSTLLQDSPPFSLWPRKPPSDSLEGVKYLSQLIAKPTDFAKFLAVTEFYSKICTR